MKRYVKASFDNPIPEILMSDKYLFTALDEAGYDVKKLKFYTKKPNEVATPVYVLDVSTKSPRHPYVVWIPGVYNDTQEIYDLYSDKYRKIKSIAKKKLPIVDTFYVDLTGGFKAERDHYRDPRYVYNERAGMRTLSTAGSYVKLRQGQGAYGGQEKDLYGRWTSKGAYSYGENGYKRDKSGYAIPNPRDRLIKFYTSDEGVQALKQRVQGVYDSLINLRQTIFDLDFTAFGKLPQADDFYSYSYSAYAKVLRDFGTTCQRYRKALTYIEHIDDITDYLERRSAISNAFGKVKSVEHDIKETLESIDHELNEEEEEA